MTKQYTRRITPDDVRAALNAHPEIVLAERSMRKNREGVPHCCALGAVFFGPPELEVWENCRTALGEAYMNGFYTAFDGLVSPTSATARYLDGYEDGLRCRQELLLS